MSNVPEVGSVWRHRNGAEYRVIHLANFYSSDVRYPLTVVYQGVVNGKVWSRPMDQWHRSMTLIEAATQPAAGEPEQQAAINADDLPTKKYPLGAFDFDAPVAGGELVRVVAEPGEELSPSNLVGNRIDRMLTIGTRLYTTPPAAAHGDGAVEVLGELVNEGMFPGSAARMLSFMFAIERQRQDEILRTMKGPIKLVAMRAQAREGGEV